MIGAEWFSVEQSGEVTVVRIVDTREFDTDSYAQLQQNLAEFVASEQPRKLLVDLSNVYLCSTALIAGLIMAQKRIESCAGVMKLFGLSEVIMETLQRLKLAGTVLQVCTDEADARKAVETVGVSASGTFHDPVVESLQRPDLRPSPI